MRPGLRGLKERFQLAARRSMFLEELEEEKRALRMDGGAVVDKITFSSPLKVVRYPDPRLRAPNAEVKLPAAGLKELADQMFNIMYTDDGIGLAAPQVGVNIQMMVFNPEGIDARGDKTLEKVLVNPRIVKESKSTEVSQEGCLSFPGMLGDVERPVGVKIKARGLDGEKIELKLNGLVSRIFQHEFDHLQGVLFFERMSRDMFEMVRPQLVEWEEDYLRDNPGNEIERVV